jgi:hypothetical protein
MIPKLHLNFKDIPAGSVSHVAKEHKRTARYLRAESAFSRCFWHTPASDLHSRTQFLADPLIIPASQVLSKNAAAGSS